MSGMVMMMVFCLEMTHLGRTRLMIVSGSHRPAARRHGRGYGQPNGKKRMEGANRMLHDSRHIYHTSSIY